MDLNILPLLALTGTERHGKQFVHEELKIGHGEATNLRDNILQNLSRAVRLANYRTHQRGMEMSSREWVAQIHPR